MILTLIPIRPFYQTSGGVRSVGDGRLRMRPPAGYDHIRKMTLSQKKPRCRRPLGPWGVKEPLVSSHISVLDRHGAQTWNYYYAGMYVS